MRPVTSASHRGPTFLRLIRISKTNMASKSYLKNETDGIVIEATTAPKELYQ